MEGSDASSRPARWNFTFASFSRLSSTLVWWIYLWYRWSWWSIHWSEEQNIVQRSADLSRVYIVVLFANSHLEIIASLFSVRQLFVELLDDWNKLSLVHRAQIAGQWFQTFFNVILSGTQTRFGSILQIFRGHFHDQQLENVRRPLEENVPRSRRTHSKFTLLFRRQRETLLLLRRITSFLTLSFSVGFLARLLLLVVQFEFLQWTKAQQWFKAFSGRSPAPSR